ncbi:LEPR-XLL domain-containing protein [Streptomyces pseudovenezuelae]
MSGPPASLQRLLLDADPLPVHVAAERRRPCAALWRSGR